MVGIPSSVPIKVEADLEKVSLSDFPLSKRETIATLITMALIINPPLPDGQRIPESARALTDLLIRELEPKF